MLPPPVHFSRGLQPLFPQGAQRHKAAYMGNPIKKPLRGTLKKGNTYFSICQRIFLVTKLVLLQVTWLQVVKASKRVKLYNVHKTLTHWAKPLLFVWTPSQVSNWSELWLQMNWAGCVLPEPDSARMGLSTPSKPSWDGQRSCSHSQLVRPYHDSRYTSKCKLPTTLQSSFTYILRVVWLRGISKII